MNSQQDNFKESIDPISVLVYIGLSEMVRSILVHDIEKRLGRKLTDCEWQYFLQESNRKSDMESRQRIISQWRQQLADRQTIHDFVWSREGSLSSR
jgi:hypothetical protein